MRKGEVKTTFKFVQHDSCNRGLTSRRTQILKGCAVEGGEIKTGESGLNGRKKLKEYLTGELREKRMYHLCCRSPTSPFQSREKSKETGEPCTGSPWFDQKKKNFLRKTCKRHSATGEEIGDREEAGARDRERPTRRRLGGEYQGAKEGTYA